MAAADVLLRGRKSQRLGLSRVSGESEGGPWVVGGCGAVSGCKPSYHF